MSHLSSETNRHCCQRVLESGSCDWQEHGGIECAGCIPFVHCDLTIDHEPDCTAVTVTFTQERTSSLSLPGMHDDWGTYP